MFLARVEDVLASAPAEAPFPGHPQALLSSRERARWESIRHDGRRREFLAARILVKYLWSARARLSSSTDDAQPVSPHALRDFVNDALASPARLRWCHSLEVLPVATGAPEVAWRGRGLPSLSVSLTHTGGWVAAALTSGERVGVDLERIEPRSPSFASLFTPAQRAWCEAQVQVRPEVGLTLVWALREAAFKAGLAGPEGRERLDIVPRGAVPPTHSPVACGCWPLQPVPVDLPGGGVGLARIFLDEGLVLAQLATSPARAC